MRTVLSQDARVRAVCGAQKGAPDETWRMTLYCAAVPSGDGVLLYHAMTGELLHLSREEYDAIPSSGPLRAVLAKKWFLVPEDLSEMGLADQVRGAVETMAPPGTGISVYTIFPTTDCNAHCFYCYEIGRSKSSMSEKTAHDAAAYILRKSVGKPVKIRWFGGEPLYNMPAMDVICSDLKAAGKEFFSDAISNGLFFDEEGVRKAMEIWNLKAVQITLDGTEEIYNRTKAFSNCEDSAFRRIFDNVSRLLDAGIFVTVRLNMDSRNADDLEALIDLLADRFGGSPKFSAYCSLLRDWGARHLFESEERALERYRTVVGRLADRGVLRKKLLPGRYPVVSCIADNDEAVTILPDGRVGKCEHCSDDGFIGSIYSDDFDESVIRAFKTRRKTIEACSTCPWYPACITPMLCADISEGCTGLRRELLKIEMHARILNSYRAARDNDLFAEEESPILDC